MTEVREKMKPLVNQRIHVRGCLVNFGYWERNYRDVGRACISMPEFDGEVLAEHVWVTDVPHWMSYKRHTGEQVEFTAVVKGYPDKSGSTNYCFANASELSLLHKPPALPIPDPIDDELPQPEVVNDAPPAIPSADEDKPAIDPLAVVRQVKGLVKAVGGFDQAVRGLEAIMETSLPLDVLLTWVRELRPESTTKESAA